jgi:hypothetical protein
MENIYDDLISENDAPPTDESPSDMFTDASMGAAERSIIKQLESITATVTIPKAKTKALKPPPDPRFNIMTPEGYGEFTRIVEHRGDSLFSPYMHTTCTLSGITRHALIEHKRFRFVPNEKVQFIGSNFGEVSYPGYVRKTKKVPKKKLKQTVPAPILDTQREYIGEDDDDDIAPNIEPIITEPVRGRTKLRAATKERKKQGTGKFFNSQVTFIYVTDIPDTRKKDRNPSGFKEYNIKMFQKNKLQFPGAMPTEANTVIAACNEVMRIIDAALDEIAEEEKAPREGSAAMEMLCPNMKNYKFHITMQRTQIIDLGRLKEILFAEKYREEVRKVHGYNGEPWTAYYGAPNGGPNEYQPNGVAPRHENGQCVGERCHECVKLACIERNKHLVYDLPYAPHPQIRDIIYTKEDSKLSLYFSTPVKSDPNKNILVNIFRGDKYKNACIGKFNVLGGLYDEDIAQVYEFLLDLFERYEDLLIVDQSRVMTEAEDDDEYEYIIIDDDDELTHDDSLTHVDSSSHDMQRDVAKYL